MKRLIPAVLVLAALGGCASTASSGVERLADGLHKVTQRGAPAGVSTHALRAQATQEAADFCTQTRKPLRVTDTRELPAGMGGRPAVEVLFKCE